MLDHAIVSIKPSSSILAKVGRSLPQRVADGSGLPLREFVQTIVRLGFKARQSRWTTSTGSTRCSNTSIARIISKLASGKGHSRSNSQTARGDAVESNRHRAKSRSVSGNVGQRRVDIGAGETTALRIPHRNRSPGNYGRCGRARSAGPPRTPRVRCRLSAYANLSGRRCASWFRRNSRRWTAARVDRFIPLRLQCVHRRITRAIDIGGVRNVIIGGYFF